MKRQELCTKKDNRSDPVDVMAAVEVLSKKKDITIGFQWRVNVNYHGGVFSDGKYEEYFFRKMVCTFQQGV